MAPEYFFKAVGIIHELQTSLPRMGIQFCIMQGFIDAVREKVTQLTLSNKEQDNNKTNWTRSCFEPWYNCYLRVDGEVRPCCTFENEIRLGQDFNLHEAYNSSVFTDLRRSLLYGDLKPSCQICPHAGKRPIQKFHKELHEFLKKHSKPGLLLNDTEATQMEEIAIQV